MKKILITGAFEGAVNLTYGESGMGIDAFPPLLHVDFSAARINDTQKCWLLTNVPPRYGPVMKRVVLEGNETEIEVGFEQAFSTKLRVIVEDMEIDFERDFWTPYGKKVNKDRCLKEWGNMSKADRIVATVRLGAYLRYLGRMGVAKADPENYLKKKYFKNDYDNL